jgi:hypothetical protein
MSCLCTYINVLCGYTNVEADLRGQDDQPRQIECGYSYALATTWAAAAEGCYVHAPRQAHQSRPGPGPRRQDRRKGVTAPAAAGLSCAGARPGRRRMTSRRAPAPDWRPATQQGWVYALCFDPWYPPWAAEGDHQVGHYIGWALNVGARLADHAGGGPHAARLLQVHIAAGGTFQLARAERGTRDRENQLKYYGFTRRCPICRAKKAGHRASDLGWIYVLHYEPPGPPGQQAQHRVVFTTSPAARLDSNARVSPRAASLLQLPRPRGGKWRLAAMERGTPDRAAQIERRQPVHFCPACKPARPRPAADPRVAQRPVTARELSAVTAQASSSTEFPQENPLAGGIPAAGPRAALLAAPALASARPAAASPARARR